MWRVSFHNELYMIYSRQFINCLIFHVIYFQRFSIWFIRQCIWIVENFRHRRSKIIYVHLSNELVCFEHSSGHLINVDWATLQNRVFVGRARSVACFELTFRIFLGFLFKELIFNGCNAVDKTGKAVIRCKGKIAKCHTEIISGRVRGLPAEQHDPQPWSFKSSSPPTSKLIMEFILHSQGKMRRPQSITIFHLTLMNMSMRMYKSISVPVHTYIHAFFWRAWFFWHIQRIIVAKPKEFLIVTK